MRNIAFMPEGDVLERRLRIAPHHPRQPANLLARDRVLFVRHRRRALLADREILRGFSYLGALQVTDLERDLLETRRQSRERRHELRMPVALDNLRRDRRGLEAKARANLLLHVGTDMRESPDGAGDFPNTKILRRSLEPLLVAPGFGVPDGQLQPERDRLGMDAVRASD